MRITILGCGSSTGVPRIGPDWGACDPQEPKNARRRCSILVEEGATRVLIDTAPDLRQQLLDARVSRLDAVVWTHDHADQCHGIDDLRMIYLHNGGPVQGYADARTLEALTTRFGYCFEQVPGTLYPPIIAPHVFAAPFRIGEIDILPIAQDHGSVVSYGFRFGDMAYSNDVVTLSDEAFDRLEGVKVWIVDAMRYRPHPTHAHVARTLEWIARLKPERAVLTNLHIDLDYATLRRELPKGVEPAYDGMILDSL